MATIDEISVRVSAEGIGEYQTGMDRAGQATQGFASSVSKAASGLQTFGSIGHQTMSIQDRMEISNMNVMNATDGVFNTQLRYNDALSKYGANSQEAIIAHNSLERASIGLEKANKRADDSFWSMGLAAVGLVPQIISLGGTFVAFSGKVIAGTIGIGAAINTAFPYIAILTVALGGMYYIWQKNKVELDTNIQGLRDAGIAMQGTTADAAALRTEVEKPVKTPSLMDMFNATVFQDEQGKFQHRTAAEIEKYNTPEGQNERMFGKTQSVIASDTAVELSSTISYEDRLRQVGLGWAVNSRTPEERMGDFSSAWNNAGTPPVQQANGLVSQGVQPYEAPSIMDAVNEYKNSPQYKIDMKGIDETRLAININDFIQKPRELTVINNITVDKSTDPMEFGKTYGKGIGQGLDYSRFK